MDTQQQGVTQEASVTPCRVFGLSSHRSSHTPKRNAADHVALQADANGGRIQDATDSGSWRRPAWGWACLFTPGPPLRWNRTAKHETWQAVNLDEGLVNVKRERRGVNPWVAILPEMETLLRDMAERAYRRGSCHADR